jgi:hypothetical protein
MTSRPTLEHTYLQLTTETNDDLKTNGPKTNDDPKGAKHDLAIQVPLPQVVRAHRQPQ